MNLKEKLIEVMVNSGVSTPAIMFNGRYIMHQGKRVYVEYVSESATLKFFIKTYSNTQGMKKASNVPLGFNLINWLRQQLISDSLFGFKVSGKQELERAKIEMNVEYEFINIESELYQDAVILSQTTGKYSFTVGGKQVTLEEANVLKKVFLDRALVDYRDVVYSSGANRFVKHLIRANKFYGIKPESFVPVFIEVKGIYNPFNAPSLAVKTTRMWQLAVEKNRHVDTGNISAYFLTHREICEAFGMEHFVRFKSSIWYDIFVGLLQVSNTYFPNNTRKVMCWAGEVQPPEMLKKIYSPEDFREAIIKFESIYPNELNNYEELNSLDAYVLKEYTTLKQIGPTFIDNKEKANKVRMCEYLNEARLLFSKETV